MIGNLYNLQAAEAHVEAGVFPVYPEQEGIQLGRFGRPQAGAGNSVTYGKDISRELENGIGYGLALGIQQLVKHLGGYVGVQLELEKALLQVWRNGGNDVEVKAAVGFLAGEVYVSFQAGDAPEVLVFQPGGLGVAVNLKQELVLSGFQIVRDAEAGQVFGIFAVAHFLTIYIYVGTALGAGQVQVYLTALPAVRNGEAAVVQGGGNGLRQHAGHRVYRAEVVGNVGVDGNAPSLHLPVAGHLDLVPLEMADPIGHDAGFRPVLSGLSPVMPGLSPVMPGLTGHLPVVFEVLEVPGSVQALVVFTLAETLGEGIGPLGEINHFRAPGLCIHRGGLDVLPVGQHGG